MTNNNKEMKKAIYTRNIDPIVSGTRFSSIVLFNQQEEEVDLHDIKHLKLCLSIPTFSNRAFTNEVKKLDTLMKDFETVDYYVISNEPVFTQKRLSKPIGLEKGKILSDFKNREFARASGTYIYELGQLVKAVFLLDSNDRVQFVRYYDDLYSNLDLNEIAKEIKNGML